MAGCASFFTRRRACTGFRSIATTARRTRQRETSCARHRRRQGGQPKTGISLPTRCAIVGVRSPGRDTGRSRAFHPTNNNGCVRSLESFGLHAACTDAACAPRHGFNSTRRRITFASWWQACGTRRRTLPDWPRPSTCWTAVSGGRWSSNSPAPPRRCRVLGSISSTALRDAAEPSPCVPSLRRRGRGIFGVDCRLFRGRPPQAPRRRDRGRHRHRPSRPRQRQEPCSRGLWHGCEANSFPIRSA